MNKRQFVNKKLLKLAILAAGAYVVASWALARRPGPAGALPAPESPSTPPSPPAYPTDPDYCYKHPDDPLCADFVGI